MQLRNFVVQRMGADNRPINYPGAVVSVYLTGTTTLAPDVTDHLGNPANPLTADANGVVRIMAPGPESGAEGIYDISAVPGSGMTPIQWLQERWADVAELAEQVVEAAAVAEAAKDASVAAAAEAVPAGAAAVGARDAALLSRGVFASTANALSNGVIDIVVTAATGSDGVYDVAFSGGGGSGAKGKIVKLGGTLKYVAQYAGNSYTSEPTITAGDLSALTYTVVIGPNADVGEYFSVPAASPGLTQLYRVDAGPVAVAVGDPYPSTASLDQILNTIVVNDDGSLSVVDPLGRVAFRIDGTTAKVSAVEFATAGASIDETGAEAQEYRTPAGGKMLPGDQAQAVSDERGRSACIVDSEGKNHIADAFIARQFRGRWHKKPIPLMAEIQHIIWYGQSWPLGFDSQPPATTERYGNTLQFNGGIRQLYSVAENPAALQSFEPAMEVSSTGTPDYPGALLGETGALACANFINRLIEIENNISPDEHALQLLISAPGEGSKTLSELANPALPYINRVKEQITRAHAIATAQGKTYCVAFVAWIQGSDSGAALNYKHDLEAMRLVIDAHAKEVCGPMQPDVKLVTWQCIPQSNDRENSRSAYRSYERFVGASDTYEHILCSGPAYQYKYVSGSNIHILPQSGAALGDSMGLTGKRSIFDGVKLQPLRPIGLTRQGKIALLELNPLDGSVLIDTHNAACPEIVNAGLELYAAYDGAAITIESVSVIGPGTIKIVAAEDIPAAAVLRNAATGTDYDPADKWRSNIRDDSAKSVGCNRWLVAFEIGFDN